MDKATISVKVCRALFNEEITVSPDGQWCFIALQSPGWAGNVQMIVQHAQTGCFWGCVVSRPSGTGGQSPIFGRLDDDHLLRFVRFERHEQVTYFYREMA